jgi:ATPase subunit of ABC transporter with duplicated ATPase domains
MLKTLVGELQPDNGTVKWSENAQIGYYAQDHEYEFENDLTVFEDEPVEAGRRRRAGGAQHPRSSAV